MLSYPLTGTLVSKMENRLLIIADVRNRLNLPLSDDPTYRDAPVGKREGWGGGKVWRVHVHLMTTAFPTFASEIIKQQKSSPWIIDSCAFCSDLNNRKPSLTHVFTVFCPLSHASWDAAYPPRFTPPHPPPHTHTPQPFSPLLSTGIAVDKSGLIYFVDGTTIRKVDRNGIISTFLGSNDLTSARPLTCDSMDINQVIFRHGAVRRRLILHVRAFSEQRRRGCLLAPPTQPWLTVLMRGLT